jgi:cytosine/adenosine deaminase-related metal-dependent hydrolase
MELVASHAGPFVSFLQEVGAWDETGLVRSIREIVAIERAAQPILFVHGNYLPGEFARDFTANTSLVYCPRTHAAFGHPAHPFREFLARGVRVCLGTDSLASNPDLDVLAEARFIHRLHPDLPGEVLLRMATLAGAEALGWGETCGSLEAGKSADLVAVPLPEREGEPYGLLFQEHSASRRTMFRGAWRAGD